MMVKTKIRIMIISQLAHMVEFKGFFAVYVAISW